MHPFLVSLGRKPRTGDVFPCSVCGKEFYRQASYIAQGRHLCSRKCTNAWQARNQIKKTCPQCSVEFSVRPCNAHVTHCSRACMVVSQTKRPTGRMHNGRPVLQNHAGYLTVYEPDHPAANVSGRILEHRWVVEQLLGRRLETTEQVHHINGEKDDNRPENLQIMTPTEHSKLTAVRRQTAQSEMLGLLAQYQEKFGPL